MRGRDFRGVLLYIFFCSLLNSFTDDVSAVKKAAQESTEIQHKPRPLCKETAFRIRTVITRVRPGSDCDAECTVKVQNLERIIGKGSASRDTCPKLGKQASSSRTPFWLDKCMSLRFHCLRRLPAVKVTTAELTEIPSIRESGSKAKISSQHDGYNHCRCYATLKLWRVFRDDITIVGDSQSTNCSNVEVCKRLTQKLNNAGGWVCIDETTIKSPVGCTATVVCRIKKDRHICRACNKGATATLDCEAVDWSEEAQKARACEVECTDYRIEAQRQFDILHIESAQAVENCGEKSLCQVSGQIDTYRTLELRESSRATEIRSSPRPPPSGPAIPPNQFTRVLSIEEPILDLQEASSTVADDFSDIDFSIFFSDEEPVSPPITNRSASFASLAANDKHPRFDQGSVAGFENEIDLDELLPKRSRWERGESSNSAHDRSMSRTHTEDPAGSRNTLSSQQSRTYASVTSSLNLLPASNNLQASGQPIQLDGSWLDIYRQLGPTDPIEPMPDLASLGSFQTNVISSVGYNAEQPDFEDLIDGDDPPSLDADADNEIDESFCGIV